MRCPKCGFISFDHLKECLKCKKNIAAKSDIMQGAVLNIAAPAFLALQADKEGETPENKDHFADQVGVNEEYLDKDLEILTMDVEPEIVDEIELADNESGESGVAEIQIGGAGTEYLEETAEEGDGEIEIDLGLFEVAADPGEPVLAETAIEDGVSAEPDIAIEEPGELAAISDIAPPAGAKDADTENGISAIAEKSDFFDMALDDLDFDLELDDLNANPAAGPGVTAEPESMLVLDDFDFSDNLSGEAAETGDSQNHMEMEGDLNFDLDLGGLSMHEEL